LMERTEGLIGIFEGFLASGSSIQELRSKGMIKTRGFWALVLLWGLVPNGSPSWASSGLEWTLLQQVKLPAEPLDVTVSQDGKWFFVLTQGQVLVFQAGAAEPMTRMEVGKEFDRLTHSAAHEALVLSSRSTKSIEVIRLEFIEEVATEGLPFKGSEKAPVTIAVFDDYQCPYCARLEPQLKQILERYPQQVKLVIKQFPLKMHPQAMPAAKAALAAHRQGKFWDMHEKLFQKQNELNEIKIKELAQSLGLDMGKFEKDMKDPEIERMINQDLQNGFKIQVQGTPTVFVNGKLVRRADIRGILEVVESELKRKKAL
jgi:predicted DsbA family dithiol-disulfide isomerase